MTMAKEKPVGKEHRNESVPPDSGRAKANTGHSFGVFGPQAVNVLEGKSTDADSVLDKLSDDTENERQQLGTLGKISRVKTPTLKDTASGPRFNFRTQPGPFECS